MAKSVSVSEAASLNLLAKQNSTFDLTIVFGDGTRDLSANGAYLKARLPESDLPDLSLSKTANGHGSKVEPAADGKIRVLVAQADMQTLAARNYLYDIWLDADDAGAEPVEPVCAGLLIVEQSEIS